MDEDEALLVELIRCGKELMAIVEKIEI